MPLFEAIDFKSIAYAHSATRASSIQSMGGALGPEARVPAAN
jgi:hypothetical protein